MSTHFNIFELTSFVTNDLSKEKSNAIENHISECDQCSKKVKDLVEQQSSFLKEFSEPPHVEINNIIKPSSNIWKKSFSIAAILLFTATLSFYFYESGTGHSGQLAHGIKGETSISFYVQNSDGTIEQRTDRIYYPGEKIQIKYSSLDYDYLMPLSIDTAGNIYSYLPSKKDSSFKIEKGAGVPFPNSIKLDNYLGKELFINIFSNKPLLFSEIKREISKSYMSQKSIEGLNLEEKEGIYISRNLIEKQKLVK